MGLRDKYYKRDKGNEFVPIDLNEANIKKIFSACIATSKNIEDNVGAMLFSKRFGYKENSRPIFFDKETLEFYRNSIRFLFGQLKIVHDGETYITPSSVSKKYTGEIWTNDSGIIMQFLHLGSAVGNIPQFDATKNNSAILGFRNKTLSPYDPNFAEWYKDYETKMKKADRPIPGEK